MKKGLRVVFFIICSLFVFFGCEKAGENQILDLANKEVIHGKFNYKNKYINIDESKVNFSYKNNEANIEIDETNNLVLHYLDSDYIIFENISSIYHNDVFNINDNIVFYGIDINQDLYKFTIQTEWTTIDEVVNYIDKSKVELEYKVTEFVYAYNSDSKGYIDPAIYCDEEVILYLDSFKIFDPEQNNIVDKYILYKDKTVSTIEGKFFVDKNGESIVIKDYVILDRNSEINVNDFNVLGESEFNTNVVFISENNDVIIETDDNKIFIYGAKVNKTGYTGSYPYIKFVDGYSLVLNANDFEINKVAK